MLGTYQDLCKYRLCVAGQIPERWARWFEGYIVVNLANGNTCISGVMDQAALHGLLSRIRDLGLELVSVERE